MTSRRLAWFGGAALSAALVCAVTSTAWAAEPTVVGQNSGVHSVYCQTPDFDRYVKFTVKGITPGGGPLCYTGTGTARIDLQAVTGFQSGAHSGSIQYRSRPGLPIIQYPFIAGQSVRFGPPVEVLFLTITS